MVSGVVFEQTAFAHIPNSEKQNLVIMISEDVSRQSLKNGQILTVKGILTANVDLNIDKPISVYLETGKLCNELNVLSTEPQGVIGFMNKGDKIPYEIELTLDSGVFHIHTMVNVESFGPAIGKGTIIVVEDSPDSPKTSQLCDEDNSFWIVLWIILATITIIVIVGFFISKRKTTSKSKWSVYLVLMGITSMIVSVSITFRMLEYWSNVLYAGLGLGIGLIILGLILNAKSNNELT